MGDTGGGPELPAPNAAGGQSCGVLLAVLPWPEEATASSMKQIHEEFPDLELHYVYHDLAKAREGGQPDVPEGNDKPKEFNPMLPHLVLPHYLGIAITIFI